MGKVDGEYSNPQAEASRMLEAALQQMDGIIHGVKLDNVDTGEVPAPPCNHRDVLDMAESLSQAITDASYLPSLPSQNVALIINKWINQDSKTSPYLDLFEIMSSSVEKETTAMLELRKGVKVRGNVASVIADLEKRQRRERTLTGDGTTTAAAVSAKGVSATVESVLESCTKRDKTVQSKGKKSSCKGQEESNSSPEEGTVKPTWSGSGSPAVATSGSGSDFSSSDEAEDKETKRNSMTKDCNEDFRWLPPEQPKMNSSEEPQRRLRNESNPFYSMDRNRRILDAPVHLRLPPQSPGSLDRKRVAKTRSERDHKSKSTVITRRTSPETQEHWEAVAGWCMPPPPPPSCQHCHHYRPRPPCSCRSYYGSCESIQSQQSQRNLKLCGVYEDHSCCHSTEWLCPPQPHRDKAHSWRYPSKFGPEVEERMTRLENDKESLQLQVTVLTEQVEAQSEKISDLQHSLEDKKHQLNSAEDLLQREMLSRSSLETQKLELMSAISELRLQHAALERENYELKEERKRAMIKPPIMPRNTSPALLQSAANRKPHSANPFSNNDAYYSDSPHSNPFTSTPNNHVSGLVGSPSPSPVNVASLRRDDMKNYSLSPAASLRRSMDQYNSLPRQRTLDSLDPEQCLQVFQAEAHRKAVAFGKAKSHVITLRSEKSYSAPNLAETERLSLRSNGQDLKNEMDLATPVEITPPLNNKKGIKKIFNKIKRSHSGNVNDLGGDEFRRGGIRATAGPRLGGPIVRIHLPPDKPFADWDCELVCDWLEDLGLENYVADMRRWGRTGAHLLAASSHDFDKELAMKNPLHRKKLCLALQEVQGCNDELLRPAGQLDTHWVLRWLDDVGLPQHKEVFLTGRIDGRMLHRLTMDDLTTLHITSLLHVASFKRGIKVLREHGMDPNCLTRRSVPGEATPTAPDVALWTNHRVMEWLRVVDLAEYAPNLRGSGVHGALMVYEPKFTAELLASLLSIPPSKTLLRRHLSTHFKDLLGRDVIHNKREAEAMLGYIPLTAAAKVKTVKKAQFTLKRKKSRGEFDYGDLVCPLTEVTSGSPQPPAASLASLTTTSYSTGHAEGMMKETRRVPDVCPLTDPSPRNSPLADRLGRV